MNISLENVRKLFQAGIQKQWDSPPQYLSKLCVGSALCSCSSGSELFLGHALPAFHSHPQAPSASDTVHQAAGSRFQLLPTVKGLSRQCSLALLHFLSAVGQYALTSMAQLQEGRSRHQHQRPSKSSANCLHTEAMNPVGTVKVAACLTGVPSIIPNIESNMLFLSTYTNYLYSLPE